MAGGEPVPAGLYQRRTFRVAFGKKAKAFKDSAVAKARSIAKKRVIVAVTVGEINRQAIGHVLDSTAQGRIIQYIDHRAINIGDKDFALTAPDGFRSENLIFADMLETEQRAVALLEFLAHGLSRQDNDIAENLLGEIPVLCGATPADIGRIEQGGHQYPRIVKHMGTGEHIDRHRDIDATADTAQPALLHPPREQLRGPGTGDIKGCFGIFNAHDVAGLIQDSGKAAARSWHCGFNGVHNIFHYLKFTKFVNLCHCNILFPSCDYKRNRYSLMWRIRNFGEALMHVKEHRGGPSCQGSAIHVRRARRAGAYMEHHPMAVFGDKINYLDDME